MSRLSPQERLERAILGAVIGIDLERYPFTDVKAEPWMAAELRKAETAIRQLRCQVEERLAPERYRPCAYCRGPVAGRADRKYCSDRCRQAAHRLRRPQERDRGRDAP
jgi:hypothetical protein